MACIDGAWFWQADGIPGIENKQLLRNEGEEEMLLKPWLRGAVAGLGVMLASFAHADFPSVPKETYKALNLEQSASPKQLHEALVKRYKDPAQGAGRGTLAKYWEPIPM